MKACNGFGRINTNKGILSLRPDYEYNYIKHYYSKSAQEFVEKMNRGDLLRGNEIEIIEWAIEKFFYINEITKEKIEYIQSNLGYKYNVEKIIEKLKNEF